MPTYTAYLPTYLVSRTRYTREEDTSTLSLSSSRPSAARDSLYATPPHRWSAA